MNKKHTSTNTSKRKVSSSTGHSVKRNTGTVHKTSPTTRRTSKNTTKATSQNLNKNMRHRVKRRKKKKNNSLRNIFIFLIIFLCIMGGLFYIIQTTEDTNKDGSLVDDIVFGETKELDLTNKTVNRLYNLFVEDSIFKRNIAKGLNDTVNSRLFYTYLTLKDEYFKEVSCNDAGLIIIYGKDSTIDGLCSLNTTYPEEIDLMEQEIRASTTYGIKLDKFKKKYKEVFGDVVFAEENFYYEPLQLMYYDSRTGMYLKYGVEYLEEEIITLKASLKEATLRGNKLIIVISYEETEKEETINTYNISYTFEKNKETNKYYFMSRLEE